MSWLSAIQKQKFLHSLMSIFACGSCSGILKRTRIRFRNVATTVFEFSHAMCAPIRVKSESDLRELTRQSRNVE